MGPSTTASGHRIELCINVENADKAVTSLGEIGARIVMAPQDLPGGNDLQKLPVRSSAGISPKGWSGQSASGLKTSLDAHKN